MLAYIITPPPPWGTLFTIDISKPLDHMTPYTLSEHTSPACQWPLKVSICPLKSVMPSNCSQVKTLARTSNSLFRNSLVVKTHSFISCPGGWSQTNLQVKKPDVEVLGYRGYMWSAVGRLVGNTATIFKMMEVAFGREITLNYVATALVDIPAVSIPIAHSLKT